MYVLCVYCYVLLSYTCSISPCFHYVNNYFHKPIHYYRYMPEGLNCYPAGCYYLLWFSFFLLGTPSNFIVFVVPLRKNTRYSARKIRFSRFLRNGVLFPFVKSSPALLGALRALFVYMPFLRVYLAYKAG